MKKRKKRGLILILFFFGLFLVSFVSGQIIFSEIMFNPLGEESKHEWIEVYNNGTNPINFSQWKLGENGHNRSLSSVQEDFMILPEKFAIISNDYPTFLLDYPLFSEKGFDSNFGLSNSGEELLLINHLGLIVGCLNYTSNYGVKENQTLCLYNNSWQACLPTPGEINTPFNQETELPEKETDNYQITLSPYLKKEIFLNEVNNQLFKISIKNKNCSVQDEIMVEYQILGYNSIQTGNFTKLVGCSSYTNTGEFNPLLTGNYTLCGKIVSTSLPSQNYSKNLACVNFTVIDSSTIPCNISLNLETESNLIYLQDQSIKFKPTLNLDDFSYTIDYWIEDLFGNLVKNKVTTTNTNQKSWKANIEETDRVILIKAKVFPKCQDQNLSDNFAEKMFIVTNQDFNGVDKTENSLNSSTDSSIKIIKVTPEDPTFGELLKVELEIYKGNNNKYAFSAWVEKDNQEISEKTKFNLKTKYQTYKITLPLQLDANCELKIDEGKAKIIIEGLDETADETIGIKGINKNLCSGKNYGSSSSSDSSSESNSNGQSKLSYEIISLPESANLNQPLSISLRFNGDNQEHEFEVWSYLYRGSKCYSCGSGEREDNLQKFSLKPEKNKEIEFILNPTPEIEPGDYNLKIKIIKDHQKTEQELTETITFVSGVSSEVLNEKESSQNLLATSSSYGYNNKFLSSEEKKLAESSSGLVIYQSSSEKAKKAIFYILIVTLTLLCFVLVRGNRS